MAEYLEPCPCCGAPGKLKDIHTRIRQGWVGCPACGLYIQWKISPDGAIKKWNARAWPGKDLSPLAVNMIMYTPTIINMLAARYQQRREQAFGIEMEVDP